jgi:hypothetical protein
VLCAIICQFHKDSRLLHIWLAGQAIHNQYQIGLYANISRDFDKFSSLLNTASGCKNKSFFAIINHTKAIKKVQYEKYNCFLFNDFL